VPELSPDSEIPDVVPSHADENAAPVVKKVAATTTAKVVPARAAETPAPKRKPVAAAPAAPAAIATAPARSAGRRTHVVTKGDTVFNIAKRYGFTAEDIAKANSLDSEYRIRMGQQLRIPVKR
jgi:LysM repeat protein